MARDFLLMTRQVVDAILELKEVNRFSKGLFSWVGFDVAYVSYENRERVAGETSWSFWKLLNYSLDGFINFSEVPLKLATWAGTFSFLISLVGIFFVVIRKLTIGGSVAEGLGKPCLNHSLYRRNPTLSLRYHRELHFKDFPRNQETAGVYC